MLTERTPRWQKAKCLSVAMRFLAAMVVWAVPHSGAWGAELRARVHVDYTGSSLSVEAHDVSVQDVLLAIGDQVGFTVTSIGPITAPVLHLFLQNASVEDVLDTLLGGRNYGVSYHTASASGHGIDQVFVLGAPDSAGAVTSRVLTMGDHYPRATQDSLSSLTEFRDQAQKIFNQWREHEELNALHEQNLQDPLHMDTNVARQHQQDVEKARDLFDTLRQATQIERVNGEAEAPSHLGRSTSELEQGLESFHDVLMEVTRKRQQ